MEQLYQEFGTVWRFKGKNIYFGGFMDDCISSEIPLALR